ncbi:hypothetical protein RQP46_010799 [Phenoliferia psychrophenolica]
MKVIYGGPWVKSGFYDGLQLKDKAGKRRKAIMPTFSTANLRATTPLMHSYINKFIAQVENAQEEGSVDVFRWYRLLACDIIAVLAFEHKFNMRTTSTWPVGF